MESTMKESVTDTSDTKAALKMFLLSLMPELQEFSDSQIKTFKRRVFTVIDEISNPTEDVFQPTLYASAPSPHSVYSHTSVCSIQSPASSVHTSETSSNVATNEYYTSFSEGLDLTNLQ
ncbi:hypothetical protein RI129_000129 [Pyrocoelia pectoralis]|uniref:BESS domain-containing protein n=1 Tax=Pyrocoelia pectoralis TaxID=417401 RepID=A0AAN7V247_9COLE